MMPRIFDYAYDPPRATASHPTLAAGTAATSYEDALHQEQEYTLLLYTTLDGDDFSSVRPIDFRKLEDPLFPLVVPFEAKWALTSAESGGVGEALGGGSHALSAGDNPASVGRYHILYEFQIPDLGDLAKIDFFLLGAHIRPGKSVGLARVRRLTDDEIRRQTVGGDPETYTTRSRVAHAQLFWTADDDNYPEPGKVLPLSRRVQGEFAGAVVRADHIEITPGDLLGDELTRLASVGRILVAMVFVDEDISGMENETAYELEYGAFYDYSGELYLATGLSQF